MSTTQETAPRPEAATDERVKRVSLLRRLLVRPEMGAIAGAIAVWIFFAIVAGDNGFLSLRGTSSYLSVASEQGIVMIAVALLMIGGEFDLSVGSMIGATSMIITLLTTQAHWNIWAAIVIALLFAAGIGYLNAYLVLRTGLPSFIVTLASLFILRGLTIAAPHLLTGLSEIGGVDQAGGYDQARAVFASGLLINGVKFPISILWWVVLAAIATWVLVAVPFGNWIFSVGGDVNAARNIGVPINRVKITLFVLTALAACLVAIIQTVEFTGTDPLRGTQQEFYTIIGVVVGGTLLTGGYGSVIGPIFGALILGMVQQGIVYTGVDADWYQVFLGAVLLGAVVLNTYVRKYAMETRR